MLAEALRVQRGGNPAETQLEAYGNDFPTHDGSCIRDYVHVSDLCDAHLLAARRLLAEEVTHAECYNLANGTGYSVLDVIAACREVTGQPIRFTVKPRRAGDAAKLTGNAQKAAEVLGWRAQRTGLREIIETAWQWMLAQEAS